MRAKSQRPDVQVFAEIGIIDQLATTRMDRLLPVGLTSAQFSVLNHLAVHGCLDASTGDAADPGRRWHSHIP